MMLFENLGYKEQPFSGKTAETEKEHLKHIFIKPVYFKSLIEGIQSGTTKFVIGQRGHGKTAIMQELERELANTDVFWIHIREFDDISIKVNEREFVQRFIIKLAEKYAVTIVEERDRIKQLSKRDKEILELVYTYYYKPLSQAEFEDLRNKVRPYKKSNWFKRNILNKIIGLLRLTDEIAQHYTAKMLKDIIQNPSMEMTYINVNEHYLKEFKEKKPSQENIKNTRYWTYGEQKRILSEFAAVIRKTGLDRVVIILDRMDEYQPVATDIEKISEFTKGILRDNTLVINDNLSFVVSLWSQVKKKLEIEGIRFDKVEIDNIHWNKIKLKEILDSRLAYFSNDGPIIFEDLIQKKIQRDKILDLANGSPRDLILIMKSIYNEQNFEDDSSKHLTENNIDKGIRTFIENYNFTAHSAVIKKKERGFVQQDINCLLKVQQMQFDLGRLKLKSSLKNSNQANDLCNRLISLELIKEDVDFSDGGHKLYTVIDPKIEYLIKSGVRNFN